MVKILSCLVLFLNKNKVVMYNNYNLKVVSLGMLFINKKCSQLTTLFIVLKYYYQSIDYTSSLFKV